MKSAAVRSLTGFPVVSITDASSSTAETDVSNVTSNGFRSTKSRAVRPAESLTATAISRAANGLSSTHSTAYGAPSLSVPMSLPSTKNSTGLNTVPFSAVMRATMRVAPDMPVRPSGEVMRTESPGSAFSCPNTTGSRTTPHPATARAAATRGAIRRMGTVIVTLR